MASVNEVTSFVDCLTHYSLKDKKKQPDIEVFYAGLLGVGCNIGLSKIASVSKGISKNILENTVNWHFSNENITLANQKVLKLINKLSLPKIFKKQKRLLHTSSDGQKMGVSADSLNSNYSFKYLG